MVTSKSGMALCTLSEREVLTDFIQTQMREIKKLKEENTNLKKRTENSIDKLKLNGISIKDPIEEQCLSEKVNEQTHFPQNDNKEELLSDRITSLSGELRKAEEQYRDKRPEDADKANEYIVVLQTELEILTQEFDKRFSETIQFKNLKRMLEGKNSQLRQLRIRLREYEPDHEL